MKIKICGLRSLADINLANKYAPDFIGFVLAPSKRQINIDTAYNLRDNLYSSIKSVGVFVNESPDVIREYVRNNIINIVQLHGDEDMNYIKSLRDTIDIPIVKALRVDSSKSHNQFIEENGVYLESEELDYVLFDKYKNNLYGGSGESFDWSILKEIKRNFFLAGGVGIENIEKAASYNPYAIDLSSKVEINGVKDEAKIAEIMEKVRSLK